MHTYRYGTRALLLLALLLLLVACGGGGGTDTTAPPSGSQERTDSTLAPWVPTTTAPPVTVKRTPFTTVPVAKRPSPTPEFFYVTVDPANGTPRYRLEVPPNASPVSLGAAPTKAGETFLGWFYDPGTWKKPYHGEIIVSDCMLTARYAPRAHTVRFSVGSAKASFTEVKVASGSPLIDFPSVWGLNTVADSWYLDKGCTVPYEGQPITADTTLYPMMTRYLDGHESALPIISIRTTNGAAVTSKEQYLSGTLSVSGGPAGTSLSAVGVKIRGRGNSTWQYFSKKPYRLKLDTGTDLLGLGEDRDFVLLANAGDPSMLHNYTLFTAAHLLGDTVTSRCVFVTLYLNGSYEGVYLLCEQTEQGNDRVPIDKGESGAADVGYLVEFGGNAADPERYGFRISAVTHNGTSYAFRNFFTATVKSPDATVLNSSQKSYIKSYVNRVNRAIFTEDYATFSSLCDTRSFATAFLANMILLNNDMDFSCYFYKPAGGKLCFGPLWDADQSGGTSLKTGTITEGWHVSRYDHWLTALLRMPEFRDEVYALWQAHRAELLSLPQHLRGVKDTMAADIAMNGIRHGTDGAPYWRQCPEHFDYTTYDHHFEFYYEWLTDRLAWMDSEIASWVE